MNCQNCGARLDLPHGGQGVASCQYCGAETLLPSPASQQQPWAQQQQWAHHRAQVQAAHVQHRAKRGATLIALTAILPLAIFGVIALTATSGVDEARPQATRAVDTSAGSSSPASDPAAASAEPAAPTDWLGKACLADANGDNVMDLAGLIGEREDGQAAILDGATGEELWRAGSFAELGDVFCPLEGWIAVAVPDDFKVDFFPVQDAEAGQVSRTLSDEPREWGAGDGCVSIRSSDGRTTGVSLPEGSETDCGARPDNDLSHQPGMQRLITRDVYRVEHEGVTYTLRERQRGTEFLEVSAKQGGEKLWEVPLRVLRAGGGTGVLAMVATPGTIVVFGSDRKNDDQVSILGLDEKTGVERWSRELPERSAVSLRSVHYNGRYVVYTETWRDEIVAVDPASGEQVWRVGG